MATRVRVELNRAGVIALLKSSEMQTLLRARAERVAAAAGPGMEVEAQVGRYRARATVITATPEARKAEAKDRRLSSSLQAGA